MSRPLDRARVTRDVSVLPTRRWLVSYHGHRYPFPTHARAVEAASNPDHLCRHTCVCSDLWRQQQGLRSLS